MRYQDLLRYRRGGPSSNGGFQLKATDGFWFHVGTPESNTADQTDQYGWKFHISTIAEDLPRAWNELLPLLNEFGVTAKVVTPESARTYETATDHHQHGKMITVFLDERDPSVWRDFAVKAEVALRNIDVRAGNKVASDLLINGSWYLYYRCDQGALGGYIAAGDSPQSWLPYIGERQDPFADFRMDPADLASEIYGADQPTRILRHLNHAIVPLKLTQDGLSINHHDSVGEWTIYSPKGQSEETFYALPGDFKELGKISRRLQAMGIPSKLSEPSAESTIRLLISEKDAHSTITDNTAPILYDHLSQSYADHDDIHNKLNLLNLGLGYIAEDYGQPITHHKWQIQISGATRLSPELVILLENEQYANAVAGALGSLDISARVQANESDQVELVVAGYSQIAKIHCGNINEIGRQTVDNLQAKRPTPALVHGAKGPPRPFEPQR